MVSEKKWVSSVGSAAVRAFVESCTRQNDRETEFEKGDDGLLSDFTVFGWCSSGWGGSDFVPTKIEEAAAFC